MKNHPQRLELMMLHLLIRDILVTNHDDGDWGFQSSGFVTQITQKGALFELRIKP